MPRPKSDATDHTRDHEHLYGVSYMTEQCKVDDCWRPPHIRGFCGPHYNKVKRYGDPLAGKAVRSGATDLERWSHYIDVQGDCWIWTGSKNSQGYSGFYYHGGRQSGHVVGWLLLVGPVPAGLELDHLCRVPSCVNPDHLEPVTSRENTRRGAAYKGTRCVAGHFDWYYRPDRPGARQCRECRRIRRRRKAAA